MGKISDMVMCDLRYITSVEQAQAIEEISDIVMLVLPKDAPAEVMSAIAAIPKNDIVIEIPVSKDAKISTINGSAEINDAYFSSIHETLLVINGMGIITHVVNPCSGTIVLNGMMIINENVKDKLNLDFASVNGNIIYARFDEYKIYGNKFVVDSDFLKYVKHNTALIAGNKLVIAGDVTVEMLQESGIQLIAGNRVVCRREIAGYIKSVATVGNKIEISEDEDTDED
jgi:uncharacterized protein YlzI (FlbEa/FlbD family)